MLALRYDLHAHHDLRLHDPRLRALHRRDALRHALQHVAPSMNNQKMLRSNQLCLLNHSLSSTSPAK